MDRGTREIMFRTANTIFNLLISCIQCTFIYTNNTLEILIAKVFGLYLYISGLKLRFPDFFRWTLWLYLFHNVLRHLPTSLSWALVPFLYLHRHVALLVSENSTRPGETQTLFCSPSQYHTTKHCSHLSSPYICLMNDNPEDPEQQLSIPCVFQSIPSHKKHISL